jgi:hypothetical protein
MNINEKIKKLSLDDKLRFDEKLLDVLESPKDYPVIYSKYNLDKIDQNVLIVKRVVYADMFEQPNN